MPACLFSSSITIYDIYAWACTKIKFLGQQLVFRLFGFYDFSALLFLGLSFSSFCNHFCCSGGPSTGVASSSRVPVKASSRKEIRT